MEMWSITPDLRQQAIDRLAQGDCSCVIVNGERFCVFHRRGVEDLYRLLYDDPTLLRNAFIADKVVGKGAAALMIMGGVGAIFTRVASTAALELLRAAGVSIDAEHEVPHIINRAQTGLCPVESLCADCRTAEECLPRIETFLRNRQEKTTTK